MTGIKAQSRLFQKLVIDFPSLPTMVRLMPSEASLLLVQHLCLEAGRLMENASVQLAHALPTDPDERAAYLQQMMEAAADISSLMNAAEALNRRVNETD